jgi:hypothetical protein
MLLYSYKLHHSDIQIVTPEGQNKYATSTKVADWGKMKGEELVTW